MRGENELDDGGFYKPTKSTLRAAPSTKSYRLPHVSLAARLEKEILGLWNSRFASAFQYPVPKTIRGYYEKIKNPISLVDIRNRNGEIRATEERSHDGVIYQMHHLLVPDLFYRIQ